MLFLSRRQSLPLMNANTGRNNEDENYWDCSHKVSVCGAQLVCAAENAWLQNTEHIRPEAGRYSRACSVQPDRGRIEQHPARQFGGRSGGALRPRHGRVCVSSPLGTRPATAAPSAYLSRYTSLAPGPKLPQPLTRHYGGGGGGESTGGPSPPPPPVPDLHPAGSTFTSSARYSTRLNGIMGEILPSDRSPAFLFVPDSSLYLGAGAGVGGFSLLRLFRRHSGVFCEGIVRQRVGLSLL